MMVVFGATGKTGGAAARALRQAGQQVRAVGRNAERLRDLAEMGAETQTADLEDAGSVERALAGAEAAYVLLPPNLAVEDFRAYQRRLSAAVTEAVSRSSVKYVALLSSFGAHHPSGTGPVVGLHEFEQQLQALREVNVLAVRAGYFMENFLMNVPAVKATGVLSAPAPPQAPLTLVAAEDIGRYAARRLEARDFRGFSVANVMGPRLLSFEQVARQLGAAIGKPDLPYVQSSYEDAEQGMIAAGLKPQLASLYLEMYRGAAAGLLQPEPGAELTYLPTPFEQFAPTFARAYAQKSAA